jgi:hypothetical protein
MGPIWRETHVFRTFQGPQQMNPPSNFPSQRSHRDAPFPEPSVVCLSKSLVNETRSTFPNGAPMERYARYRNLRFPISRRPQLTRYPDKTNSYLPLKVLGKGVPPFPCHPTGPLQREMGSIARASGLFFHSHLSGFPVKEQVENIRAHILLGAAWFPKGIVYNTAITTPVPCSLWHDTFHLGLGRPEPR